MFAIEFFGSCHLKYAHRWPWQRWVLDLYCIVAHCARIQVIQIRSAVYAPYLKHTRIVVAIYDTLCCSVLCWFSTIVLSICPTVHIFIHSCLHLSFSAIYSIHRFVTVTIHRYGSNHSTGLDSWNDLWKVYSDSCLRRSVSPRSMESCHSNYSMSPRMWVTSRRSVGHCSVLYAFASDARTLK